MNVIRRKTTCPVPGHGTRCEVSRERGGRFPRPTETRLVMRYETIADEGNAGTPRPANSTEGA